MSENNNNNTIETRDIEDGVVSSGNRSTISQIIVHVHSESKTILIFLCLMAIAVTVAVYFPV